MAEDLAFHRCWPARAIGKLARYSATYHIKLLGTMVL